MSSSADWPYICVHEITSWLEWPLKGTAESRRIIQPLKSSDIILLLRTFHLSKDDCATSRYNFSFHYSMGGSHTYEVSGLAISTCQLFCPSSLERCHWWTNQARQALIKWSAYYIQLWHTQKNFKFNSSKYSNHYKQKHETGKTVLLIKHHRQHDPGSGWSVAPDMPVASCCGAYASSSWVKVGFTLVKLQDDQNKMSSGPLWNSIPWRFLTGAGVYAVGERQECTLDRSPVQHRTHTQI